MALKLYDTLTRSVRDFQPADPPVVRLYACGPTVYDHAHIGNYRAFLVYDLLHRYLTWSGYDVDFVMNLTDVDAGPAGPWPPPKGRRLGRGPSRRGTAVQGARPRRLAGRRRGGGPRGEARGPAAPARAPTTLRMPVAGHGCPGPPEGSGVLRLLYTP